MNRGAQTIGDEPRDLFDEIHDLILARFSEQITLEQLKRLEHLILTSEAARQLYLVYMHDQANLRRMLRAEGSVTAPSAPGEARELDSLRESLLAWRLNVRGKVREAVASRHADEGLSFSSDPSTTKPGNRVAPGIKSAAAVLLLAAAAVIALLVWPSADVPVAPPKSPTAPATMAVLTETHRAVWADSDGHNVTIGIGQTLAPQKLTLTEGVAKITIRGDIVVVLDAREQATTFEFKSNREGQLHHGRLTFHAQPRAASYSLGIPGDMQLTSGTDFGVVVEAGGRSEVFAITGAVQATKLSAAGNRAAFAAIAPHRSLVFQPGATPAAAVEIAAQPFDQLQFIEINPAQTLAESAQRTESTQRGKWDAYLRVLRQDPALVYYLDGASGAADADRLAAGRFHEKSAIRFDYGGDEIEIADRPSLRIDGDITVAAWVSPDRARTTDFALIVGKGVGDRNNSAERRNYAMFLAPSKTGQPRVEFSIIDRDTNENIFLQAEVVGARRWHFIVGVIRQGEMYLYCNGRAIAGPVKTKGAATSNHPLLIGRSHHPEIASPLQGALDMVAVLNRAMSAEEIESMYLAGRP